MKDVYTTTQVAKLLNVSPRTVTRWFDTGMLKGFLIPGSKHRKIPHDSLREFMIQHGLPLTMIGEKDASTVTQEERVHYYQ